MKTVLIDLDIFSKGSKKLFLIIEILKMFNNFEFLKFVNYQVKGNFYYMHIYFLY